MYRRNEIAKFIKNGIVLFIFLGEHKKENTCVKYKSMVIWKQIGR